MIWQNAICSMHSYHHRQSEGVNNYRLLSLFYFLSIINTLFFAVNMRWNVLTLPESVSPEWFPCPLLVELLHEENASVLQRLSQASTYGNRSIPFTMSRNLLAAYATDTLFLLGRRSHSIFHANHIFVSFLASSKFS